MSILSNVTFLTVISKDIISKVYVSKVYVSIVALPNEIDNQHECYEIKALIFPEPVFAKDFKAKFLTILLIIL
jgi:hypothetical protein